MQGLGLEGVHKVYGSLDIVKNVTLDVARGEFVVILGPSGCGKSTLLRMIAGLEDVSAGDILIDGARVTHLPPRKRGCAMVFQNYALYPHLTVAENIGYPLRIARVPKTERAARVAEAARVVNLGDYLDRKPSQLSGGQRQRVAMGRAIIRAPKVFLFDEPLSNLDATLRVQMRTEIRHLHQRLGVTSIFVTHDQVEAMTLADRIVVMNAGRIEQVGRPTEIYARPQSRFVAGFVGAQPMSFLDATVTPDGAAATVPGCGAVRMSSALPAWAGQTVILGLRAERIRVAAPDEPAMLTGRFDFTEELGPHAIHHVMLGDTEVLVQGPPGSSFVQGPLGLVVEPAGLHVFGAEDGSRIGVG